MGLADRMEARWEQTTARAEAALQDAGDACPCCGAAYAAIGDESALEWRRAHAVDCDALRHEVSAEVAR